MVVSAGDDNFLACWRGLQLLRMLLGPIQEGLVTSAIGVILLSGIHLLTHATQTEVNWAAAERDA